MDPVENLPDELIVLQALEFDLPSISKFCQVSRRLNRLICDNELFWRQKFIRDYEFSPVRYTGSWKLLYREYQAVWSFGSNRVGELGLGTKVHIGHNVSNYTPLQIDNFKAKSIASARYHTVAIAMDNTVWGFGLNAQSRLGLGAIESTSVPMKITDIKMKLVSVGEHHTLMIDFNNNVWMVGHNSSGQLGLGEVPVGIYPIYVDVLTQIPEFKAKFASTSISHTILIDLNNDVWSFGLTSSGQLGLGNTIRRSTPTKIPNLTVKAKFASVGIYYTLLIDLDDNVWAFGSNAYGQLGLGDTQYQPTPSKIPDLKAKFVSAGVYHSVIIDLENNVWTCGLNRHGELGLGDKISRSVPEKIPQLKARSAATGEFHTLLIDLDSNVWSFGSGLNGQLGLGYQVDRLSPTMIPNFKVAHVSAGNYYTVMIGTKLI